MYFYRKALNIAFMFKWYLRKPFKYTFLVFNDPALKGGAIENLW